MGDCYTQTTVLGVVPLLAAGVADAVQSSLRARHGSHRRARCAFLRACFALASVLIVTRAAAVFAQDESAEQPPHYLALVSAGIPMRLTVTDQFDQSRVAPAFNEVLLGYALPGGRTRHGFGLGVSWILTHDGGYTDPLYAGEQIAIMPAYLVYHTLNTDVIGVGHVGIPILVRGGRAAGLEAGAALMYRLFAGAGLFAEVDLDAYAAGEVALLASLELGAMIDFEVLP